jgi:hypothetical protein
MGQCHGLHRSLDSLVQYGDLVHNPCLGPGELGGGRPHGRSMGQDLRGR